MHKIHALQIFINFFSFFFGRNTNIYICICLPSRYNDQPDFRTVYCNTVKVQITVYSVFPTN